MNPQQQQQRSIKIAVGIATLIFLFWFVRTSGVVFESFRPQAESGKLGNPAVAGAFISLTEILVSIGGVVIVMATGLWKFAADLIAPMISQSQPRVATPATPSDFVQHALNPPTLPPERRAQLEQAILICVEAKDYKNLIACAETLAGEKFFPRQGG